LAGRSGYQIPHGLDRALFLKLAACDWIAERRNLLLTGVSGLGKSWLAWRAPPRRVPRKHVRSLHPRPRLFADLAIAYGMSVAFATQSANCAQRTAGPDVKRS
jgi:DNA replication protein DnaC